MIACTTLYGQVGDYIDFYRENGDVLHCVIGDIKNQNDAGCNQYGHQNGRCVVEFVVQYSTWYPSHAWSYCFQFCEQDKWLQIQV